MTIAPFDPSALCGAERRPSHEIATALHQLAKHALDHLRRAVASLGQPLAQPAGSALEHGSSESAS